MSYTEIYGFDKEGNAYLEDEVKNAWRGAMAIWIYLEEKYLPIFRPSYVPKHLPDSMIEEYCHYKPSRASSSFGEDNPMKEIWNLVDSDKPKECEKVVLGSTFDMVTVKKENLSRLISAFREFEGNTSLKEQADVIEKMLSDENCIAVGFNQTSVNADTWSSYGYDEETGESTPYNILTMDKHWELFES